MLNTNAKDRQKSAEKDHNIKRLFELQLYRQLRPLFRKYSRDFRKRYEAIGLFPPIDKFHEESLKLLQGHYDKVATRFNKRIIEEIGVPVAYAAILNSIQQRTDLHHAIRADASARVISKTTQKDLLSSVQEANQELIERDKRPTRDNVARKAQLKFDQKSQARLNTISTTETENPAEHAKQAEFAMLVWGVAALRDRKKQKQWQTILDSRTRFHHVEADNQIVLFNKPYTVGGQLLMYPGDVSLGATIDNVINCRCSSVPIIR